jgi:hypothetical protein
MAVYRRFLAERHKIMDRKLAIPICVYPCPSVFKKFFVPSSLPAASRD